MVGTMMMYGNPPQPPLPSTPYPMYAAEMRLRLSRRLQMAPPVFDEIVADVMRIFSDTPITKQLALNKDFVTGWRMWSFQMTKEGTTSNRIRSNEYERIQNMIRIGRERNDRYKTEWNQFRQGLSTKLWTGHHSTPYDEQMEKILQTTALVVVDCCFAVKINCDAEAIVQLLNRMFAATDGDVPSHYILLDNDLMDCEMNHKLAGGDRYIDSVDGVINYRNFTPDLFKDGICKMRVPFAMTHAAMSTSESRARKHMAENYTFTANRNDINDFAQLALMTKLRRSFKNSRVALLSDDGKLIKHAANNRNEIGIVTTNLIERTDFVEWKLDHAYPQFAKEYEAVLDYLGHCN